VSELRPLRLVKVQSTNLSTATESHAHVQSEEACGEGGHALCGARPLLLQPMIPVLAFKETQHAASGHWLAICLDADLPAVIAVNRLVELVAGFSTEQPDGHGG
jgi:hypothetical protein